MQNFFTANPASVIGEIVPGFARFFSNHCAASLTKHLLPIFLTQSVSEEKHRDCNATDLLLAADYRNRGRRIIATRCYNSTEEPTMDIYTDSIQALPPADRLRLVERIWDELAAGDQQIPLPDWAIHEAARRRDELLADSKLGLSHEEVWQRIDDARHG
jgi:putative addiction module component (TIGR02574 family)